ncbi:MAG TPA: hypothetical protein VE954_24370 [Oligoflexus sp.]|uniref:hypothetical protein n=1 Tax=Oligoflexus sp. TaxID=1971216 RepID=UPI002D644033|nr:hypothetical protein [Oligoflexus sp.]HYX36251.1 hypothetical protein [Oligoflexus sp.]
MKNNEQGGILLDILIAMGILVIVSTLAMKAKLNAKIVDDRAFAKSSSEFQLEGFTEKVGTFALNRIPMLCSNQLGMGSTFDVNGSKATISSMTNLAATPRDLGSLKNRCSKPKLSSTGQFYFCIDIEKNPDIHPNSFLGATSNVAELAIRLVDRWQQPIDCNRYNNSLSKADIGIQIYYRQYWTQPNKNRDTHQKSGFYYAVQ